SLERSRRDSETSGSSDLEPQHAPSHRMRISAALGKAEVARLLCDPGAARVGGAAREVDAAAAELDEEENVKAAERGRLDREEVAGEHARGFLAEEVLPARP